MLRFLKKTVWLLPLMAGLPSAHAYSWGGPINEPYQVTDLGYDIGLRRDIMAPKNIGEHYRRNIPVLYYSFDQNFLDYYGSNGVAAVEQAYAILNNLTNVSAYSPDLNEFPLEVRRQNYRAGALRLMDLKSHVLGMMVEQLGLADSIRYAWCLHDRVAGANCPVGNNYLVVMRNFGFVPSVLDQSVYSPYVNGVLYTYYIQEYCDNPPAGSGLSEAVSIPVDRALLANNDFIPVSAANGSGIYSGGLGLGGFFTGLTRDDVAGLRSLYRAGRVNWEDSPAGTTVFVTNNTPGGLSFLVTSNLNALVSASLTNDDAAFAALYPDVQFSPGLPSFRLVVTTNTISYYTNPPWLPYGAAPLLVVTNTYDTNVGFVYQRSFLNVVSNFLGFNNGQAIPYNDVFTNGTPITRMAATIIDTQVGTGTSPFLPYGVFALITNTTTTQTFVDGMGGNYFVVPTNACGIVLLSNLLTKTVIYTNVISATNGTLTDPGTGTTAGGTTTTTTTSSNFSSFSRTILTYATNHYFAYFPVTCETNAPGLRRGVEKITFLRRDYDSLLGRDWIPQTNFFTLTTVAGSKDVVRVYRREAVEPDFLFTAVDMLPGPAADPVFFIDSRTINFNEDNVLPGLAGPGVIESPAVFTFNKSGPAFRNGVATNGAFALDELTRTLTTSWGSFDDSTNAPVVYPNGVSLENLENMILLVCTTTTLTNARVGQTLMFQLAGFGGAPYATPPYTTTAPGPYFTWTFGPTSAGLPPGLNLAYNGSGLIYGTPTAPGTYDFVIRMADSNGRYADWDIAITVNP